MDKTTIIILITAILVSLVLGTGLGIFYQIQKDAPKIQAGEKMAATIKDLSSGMVPSIVAYGEVSAINERTITLVYNSKTIQIEVSKDAKIYTNNGTGKGTLPTAKFSDIKKGDRLNITMKVSPDGSLTSQMVVIVGSSVPIK